MKRICSRCKVPLKGLYGFVVVGGKTASFCSECGPAWYVLRDKVVKDTFNDFISTSKNPE